MMSVMGFENSVLLKQYVLFDDSMQIKKSREWIDFTELKLEIDVMLPVGCMKYFAAGRFQSEKK